MYYFPSNFHRDQTGDVQTACLIAGQVMQFAIKEKVVQAWFQGYDIHYIITVFILHHCYILCVVVTVIITSSFGFVQLS